MAERNWARELDELILSAGLTVKIGLRAQGHVPTVERMLSEGATWDEIGAAIGWQGEAAKDWYERFEQGQAPPPRKRH